MVYLPGHGSPGSRPASVGSIHSATSDSNSSCISSGRGPRGVQEVYVGEEVKISLDAIFERFKNASPDAYDGMFLNLL